MLHHLTSVELILIQPGDSYHTAYLRLHYKLLSFFFLHLKCIQSHKTPFFPKKDQKKPTAKHQDIGTWLPMNMKCGFRV